MTDIEKVIEILKEKISYTKELIASGSYDNNIYNAKLETLEGILFEVENLK